MLTFEHKDAVEVVKNNLGFVFPLVADLAPWKLTCADFVIDTERKLSPN